MTKDLRASGLTGRPHGTDPLHQVDSYGYATGYIEGQSAFCRYGHFVAPRRMMLSGDRRIALG